MRIEIGQWEVEADVQATRAVYDRTSRGSPADCDCAYCRNFAALADAAFPQAFLELTKTLGIDHRKAAEIFDWCEFRDGQVDYGGWFHFIGTIEQGSTTATASSSIDQWPWYRLTEDFKIVLDALRYVVLPELDDHRLVRLQFTTREPWVLAEPYPQPLPIDESNP